MPLEQIIPEKEKLEIIQFPIKVKVRAEENTPAAPKAEIKVPLKKSSNPSPATVASVPVPAHRPDIQMASPEFVEKARRTMVDTYTVVKREGSPMPAAPRREVARESLPPARLSVADIAHDPLASQIVNLSPEELALAMNGIKPSSGTIGKPRIVRQEGERIYRFKRDKTQPEITPSVPGVMPVAITQRPLFEEKIEEKLVDAAPSASAIEKNSPLAVIFKSGETTLSVDDEEKLSGTLIKTLNDQKKHRLQIVAWASPTDGKETSARRTALARALSVRAYLISKGVDAARMDVRAMGMQTDAKAASDQVEMILIPEKS